MDTQAGEDTQRVNVLIVDDRPDKLLALESVLADLEANILTSTSGEDALRVLLKHDVAVILLDVNMPGLDGFETAALIRKRKNLEHTPIIFITGINVNENHVSRGYSLGAVDYIFAPVVPEILRAKVSVFLEFYRNREQIKRQGAALIAQAERRATDLELRLHELLNRLNVGVFSCNAEGSLIEANPAFYRIIGKSSRAPVAVEIIEQLVGCSLSERSTSVAQNTSLDVKLERDDKTTRWVSVTKAISRDVRNQVITEALIEDVTQRKIAEETLKELDKRKDRFLAILSHELRNPLSAIKSAIQLNYRVDDPAQRKWTQEILERQVRHLGRLIDDLLDVSRITQDKIQLKMERVDVAPIIHRAIEMLRPTFERHQHKLVVGVDSGLWVNGDSTRLEQILVNLLENAAKYTPETGAVRVTTTVQEGRLGISITDTGIGISPEILPKIFDLFIQSDSSLDRAQGGLGIGLTLVKRLVELHGGTVAAKSDGPGHGSEFSIFLPIVAMPTERKPAGSESSAAMRALNGTGTVLVVDDNQDSAQLAAALLRLSHYDVIVAHDGLSALSLATSIKPDAILLDIGLPGMDGFEVARKLRDQPEFQQTLIIAISGYGQEEHTTRSRAAGFDSHLVKPIDLTALLQLLSARPWARDGVIA